MIGIFDSGIGGLSVRREIVKLLPEYSTVYYADGKNCPYGHKSEEEIRGYADEITRFLIGKGAQIIVIACNAATAAAVDYLRKKYSDISFVGMEPAVKPAALASISGVIGIMATKRTLDGKLFSRTSARYADKVHIIACEGEDALVDLVEENRENSPEALEIVSRHLSPMLEAGVDHIVLGCTHYPFLANRIAEIAGSGVAIVDPAPAIARRVGQIIEERGMVAEKPTNVQHLFFSSGDEEYLKKVVDKSQLKF